MVGRLHFARSVQTAVHNGIMTKPARPHAILGEALTRNRVTTWSGLRVVLINMGVFTCTAVAPGAGLERRPDV